MKNREENENQARNVRKMDENPEDVDIGQK